MLTRMLRGRLGPPPPEAARWLAQAELPQIEATTDRIFQLESWDDLTRV